MSPIGTAAKKLVLLSIVVVRWPGLRLAIVAVPPRLSASAISAPPCMMLKRLLNSSRIASLAVTRSRDTCVILMPSQCAKGGCCRAASLTSRSLIPKSSSTHKERARACRPRPSNSSWCSPLPRLRHDADIGPRRLEALWPNLLGLVVGDRASNDHVLALFPVRRRGHSVLGGKLQRVEHAHYLVEVAARRHRIDQDQFDLFVRADDEDVAHRLVIGRRTSLRRAAGRRRQHPVGLRDLQFGIADHRVIRREPDDVLDVDSPFAVIVDRVDR